MKSPLLEALCIFFILESGFSWKMPSKTFVSDFATAHNRLSVYIFTPKPSPTTISTSLNRFDSHRLFKSRRFMRNSYIEYDSRKSISVQPPAITLRQEDLAIFIPDDQDQASLRISFDVFKTMFNARSWSSSEFWLLDISGWESENDIDVLLNELKMDLDDDIFLFMGEQFRCLCNNTILRSASLWEAYRIQEPMKPVLNYLGLWGLNYTGVDRKPIKYQRRRNMQGATIRAMSIRSKPYVLAMIPLENQTDLYRFTGICAEVVYALQERMNFTLKLMLPPDTKYGVKKADGSWTGFVGRLVNDTIDIAPIDLSVTKARSEAVSFMEYFMLANNGLFIKNPRGSFNFQAYSEPVHYTTWMTVFIYSIFVPPIFALIAKFGIKDPEIDEFSLRKSYIFMASVLTVRGWSVSPKAHASRISFFSILLFGLMIYKYWEAMLMSYLTISVTVLPFTSVDTLVTNSPYKIIVNPGSLAEAVFRDASDSVWQEAWRARVEPFLDSYEGNSNDRIQYLLSDPVSALYTDTVNTEAKEAFVNCQVLAIPAKYDFTPLAFALQKDSPYLEAFNYNMKQLIQAGILDQIHKKFASPPQYCPDFSGQALGFNSCITAFLTMIAGASLGILVFLIENCFNFCLPRKLKPLFNVPSQSYETTTASPEEK